VVPLPEIGVSKAAGVPTLNDDGTFDVEYTLQVVNTGNVDLTNITLLDDLVTQFGVAAFTGSDATVATGGIVVPPAVSLVTDAPGTVVVLPAGNTGYTGSAASPDLFTAPSTLGVGDIIEVTFTARLNPAAAGSSLTNTATAGGSDPAGTVVTDDSNDGSDPTDGAGGTGVPTPITLPEPVPEIGVSKAAGVPTLNGDGTFDVEYTLQVANTGDVDLMDITLLDDLQTQFTGAFVGSDATITTGGIIVAPVVSLVTDAAGTAVILPVGNAGFTGSGASPDLFTAPSTLGVGDIIEVTFTARLDPNVAGASFTNRRPRGANCCDTSRN